MKYPNQDGGISREMRSILQKSSKCCMSISKPEGGSISSSCGDAGAVPACKLMPACPHMAFSLFPRSDLISLCNAGQRLLQSDVRSLQTASGLT